MWPIFLSLFLFGLGEQLDTGGPCTCGVVKAAGGWCGECKVGYVAGVAIRSLMLFDALDAHGHDIDPKVIQCPSCRAAIETDGYCEACRMGFVKKQAYLSRLTYHLARGKPVDVDSLACAACKKNAEKYGWCEKCSRGMLGNVAVTLREDHDRGAKELDRLAAALATLARCEGCAVAGFTGGTCTLCAPPKAGARHERTKP